jgi:multidrug resistance efflux pump
VSTYIVQQCVSKSKITKENLQQSLTTVEKNARDCDVKYETLSGTLENCKKDVKACRIESENERGKSFKIILVASIVIILLLTIIIVESVMIWNFKTKNAKKREEIIRLDRLAPKHIYETVDQEPEPDYKEFE